MENETKELLTSFGAQELDHQLPRLTIFHTKAAWERYIQGFEQSKDLAKLSVNWAASVLLVMEFPPGGGWEASPYTSSLTGTGDIVNLVIDWRIDPNVSMLDVDFQP